MRELGHELGYGHDETDAEGLMAESLPTSVRRSEENEAEVHTSIDEVVTVLEDES